MQRRGPCSLQQRDASRKLPQEHAADRRIRRAEEEHATTEEEPAAAQHAAGAGQAEGAQQAVHAR